MKKLTHKGKKIIEWYNNLVLNKKLLLIFFIVVFLISLIPILKISIYTHPSADDYNYATKTYVAYREKGPVGLVTAVGDTVYTFYNKWQGTYSAAAIMSLQPGVINENLYFLTTFILIGALIFSYYYFFQTIINDYLKIDKINIWIVVLPLLFIMIQTLPAINQGLYWWNGASYYTLFHSFLILELGLVLKYLKKDNKSYFVLAALLAVVIAGGNYVTALINVLLLVLFTIYSFIKKDTKYKYILIILILSILGLGVSMLAPGNSVRAAAVNGLPAINAILLSFKQAAIHVTKWTNVFTLLFSSFIAWILSEGIQNLKYKFKLPLLYIIFSFCLFAVNFTPTLYSMGDIGEGRLHNVIYYFYLILLIGIIFYIIGYLKNNMIEIDEKYKQNFIKYNKKISLTITLIFISLSGVLIYFNRNNFTSVITYQSLKRGEPQIYRKEFNERYKILLNDEVKDVVFEKYTYKPFPIFYTDFTEDHKHWLNIPAARIYNKKSIRIKPEISE